MSNDQLHNTAGANLSVSDVTLGVQGVASLTPAISSISGTLTEDSTITIIGSGFSANRQGQLYYDDFSTGTLGDAVTSLDGNISYKYVDDDAYTGTRSAMWHHPDNDASLIHPRVELPDGVKEVFVYHAQKIIEIDNGIGQGGDGPQIKLTRIVSGDTAGTAHSTNPKAAMMWQIENAWNYLTLNDGSSGESYSLDSPTINKWETFTAHLKLSELDQDNGCVMVKAYGSHGRTDQPGSGHLGDLTGVTDIKSWVMPSNRSTLKTGYESSQLKKVFVPFYMRKEQEYKIYIDNLFINDTREAVILGDNQDLELASLDSVIALPMTSRASDEIMVKMKKGALTGKNAYAFVFNADGSYNSVGYDLGVL